MNPLNHQQESEARLITRAQQGDREAFGELVMNHHTAVYTTVYRMTGDAHLAEDATQQAFIKAWLHLASYQPRASFTSLVKPNCHQFRTGRPAPGKTHHPGRCGDRGMHGYATRT